MAERTVTVAVDNQSQLFVNYAYDDVFLRDNEFHSANYTNSTGSAVTLNIGTVLGRISATGLLLPLQSTATDGSQFPVGILAQQVTVADAATVTLNYCVQGDVSESNIELTRSGDTLDTVVSDRRIRDRIASDTIGINLVTAVENTRFDNT